jgi:drug/metabolite transporter (DMT)-like permease
LSDKKIYFLMTLCTVFWAGAFIAAKLSAPFIPAFTLTFLRFSIASVILYFIVIKKENGLYKLKSSDIPVFLFTGVIGMFGYHVLFFTAIKYTTAITSSIIGASNPIITALLAIIFLRDNFTPKRIIGILLSFVGVFLTITEGSMVLIKSMAFNKGDIIMLIAVFMWAVYSIYSKKVSVRYTPLVLTFYSFVFCSVFLIPFVIYENPVSFIGKVPYYSYIAVLYMSIFPSVIGYLVQQIAIKQIGPSRTSIFINLVPIFSIVLSVLLLGESISVIKVFTTLLIIIGVYICQKG